MDITNMLNRKSPADVAAAAECQFQHQMAHSVSYPSPTSTTSPTELQRTISTLGRGYAERAFDNGYSPQQYEGVHQEDAMGSINNTQRHGSNASVKAFACTTCGKGFARRSDLARHERIHSGDRPHVCPETGCGKPFIQRSALTVHMRVHSGEKPHMCERCGKPFSDSSSLARHRRIHSGKRPYKCPFADCQKTFTRRTTLTRHQNHHTGTVEEAAVATAAALASRTSGVRDRAGSDGSNCTDAVSMVSSTTRTPSPGERHDSLSPNSDVPHMPFLTRQSLSYASGESLPPFNDSLPPHLRPGLQQPSPRSSPAASSPTLSAFGGSNYVHRPSLTSHPMLPVLEPPTYHDLRQSSSGSGSPHLGGTPGWNSPVHPIGLPSPGTSDVGFNYPDPPYSSNQHLYYPNSNMRRPQSTEPDQYELKPRLPTSGGIWTGSMG